MSAIHTSTKGQNMRIFRGRHVADSAPPLEHKEEGGRATQAGSLGRRVILRLRRAVSHAPVEHREPSVTPPESRRSIDSGAGLAPVLAANEISISAFPDLPKLPEQIPGTWDPRHDCLRQQARRIEDDQSYLQTLNDPDDSREVRQLESDIARRLEAMKGLIREINKSPEYRPHPKLVGDGQPAAELRGLVGELYTERVHRNLFNPQLAHTYSVDDAVDSREAWDQIRGDLRAAGIDPDRV
jgi:hypothetical protein